MDLILKCFQLGARSPLPAPSTRSSATSPHHPPQRAGMRPEPPSDVTACAPTRYITRAVTYVLGLVVRFLEGPRKNCTDEYTPKKARRSKTAIANALKSRGSELLIILSTPRQQQQHRHQIASVSRRQVYLIPHSQYEDCLLRRPPGLGHVRLWCVTILFD